MDTKTEPKKPLRQDGHDKCPECGSLRVIAYATHHNDSGAIVGWHLRCKVCGEELYDDEPKEDG